ncbi:hypothetical protein QBC40DRAFT_170746, partial [Triangularia verruculosa]
QEPHGVDQPSQQRSTYLCSFPRFPIHRPSGESLPSSSQPSRYSLTPRTLPPFNDLHLGPKKPALPSRPFPVRPHQPEDKKSPTDTSFRLHQSSKPRTVFTSAKARPLRLVQQSRRRKPPVFYAQHSHSFLQSLTCLTINQDTSFLSFDKMASNNNPVMPKRSGGAGAGAGGQQQQYSQTNNTQEKLLADLRRQLDDSASDASSVDSRGRRRRRNNKQLAQANGGGGLTNPAVLPRLADTKPVRLQLGLNLDVEVELKARLQGDVSLTLLVEEKPTARPRESVELIPDLFGVVYGYNHERAGQGRRDEKKEMFYMRIGQMSFRQRWVEREVSSSLTATVCLLILLLGVVIGVVAGRWVDLVLFGVGASSVGVALPSCVSFGNSSSFSSTAAGSGGIVGSAAERDVVPVVMGWKSYQWRNSGTEEYRGSWVLA